MSENLRAFTRAVYAFDAVVQRVPSDRWSAPTPCPEWNAAELVAHQCAVLNGVATIAETGEMAGPTPSRPSDDPVAMWNECRDRLLTSLDVKGVLAQEGPFWFRSATVDDLCAAVTWDPVTHAWDLAVATGVDHGLADDLVAWTMPTVESRLSMLVESGRTAATVDVSPDSTVLDRYLAMVGRTP